jgi:hypothetical protein
MSATNAPSYENFFTTTVVANAAEPGPDVWAAKQALAKPSRYYGGGGTIHSSGELDVETDKKGNVVAVWFRCQTLPFEQHRVDRDRVNEMRRMYGEQMPTLTGVEVLDRERKS